MNKTDAFSFYSVVLLPVFCVAESRHGYGEETRSSFENSSGLQAKIFKETMRHVLHARSAFNTKFSLQQVDKEIDFISQFCLDLTGYVQTFPQGWSDSLQIESFIKNIGQMIETLLSTGYSRYFQITDISIYTDRIAEVIFEYMRDSQV